MSNLSSQEKINSININNINHFNQAEDMVELLNKYMPNVFNINSFIDAYSIESRKKLKDRVINILDNKLKKIVIIEQKSFDKIKKLDENFNNVNANNSKEYYDKTIYSLLDLYEKTGAIIPACLVAMSLISLGYIDLSIRLFENIIEELKLPEVFYGNENYINNQFQQPLQKEYLKADIYLNYSKALYHIGEYEKAYKILNEKLNFLKYASHNQLEIALQIFFENSEYEKINKYFLNIYEILKDENEQKKKLLKLLDYPYIIFYHLEKNDIKNVVNYCNKYSETILDSEISYYNFEFITSKMAEFMPSPPLKEKLTPKEELFLSKLREKLESYFKNEVIPNYEIKKYKDIDIKFVSSKYFSNFSKFPKLFALFGRTKVLNLLAVFNNKFSEDFIKALFFEYPTDFYIDKENEYIFAYSSPYFEENFGELEIIYGINALEKYGIDALEDATEKGHTEAA